MTIEIPYINSLRLFQKLPKGVIPPDHTITDGYGYVRKFCPSDLLRLQITAHPPCDYYYASCTLTDNCGSVLYQYNNIQQFITESNNDYIWLICPDFTDFANANYSKCTEAINKGSILTFSIKLHTTGGGASPQYYVSEPFVLTGETQGSILIEVLNSVANFGAVNNQMYEERVRPFAIRVEGGFYPKSLNIKSNDNIYEQ